MHLPLRAKVSIVLSLLVILALSLGLIVSGRIAAHASGESITLSPTAGPPTTSVTISGTGFSPGETVNINFDSTPMGTATTDASGAFTTPITIPNTAQPGNHNIVAVGANSQIPATAVFNVQTNWSMLGFDSQQDHFNPYENTLTTSNVNQLAPKWTKSTQPGLYSEPVVANGIAYVTTSSAPSTLYAFDANTGEPKWSYPIPGTSPFSFGTNSVVVDNGKVFAAAGYKNGTQQEGGALYAFDPNSGKILWNVNLASDPTTPTVANGDIYVGTIDHSLYAFDESGNQLWATSVGGLVDSPTLASETINGTNTLLVFVGLPNSKVQILYASNGGLYASRTITGTVTAQVVIGTTLFVSSLGSTGPNLYAFNATTGFKYGTYIDPAGYGYSSITVANGIVYAASGSSSAGTGTLTAFNFNNQSGFTAKWSVPTGGSSNNLTVANGVLYANFSNNTLKAFDITSGTPLWSPPGGSSAYSNGIAVVNGIVYVGAVSGDMYAFNVYVPDGNPTITLTGIYTPPSGMASGPPTSSVIAQGSNFGDSENVTITFDTTQFTTTTSSGAFNTTITVPASEKPGNYIVTATGAQSGLSAQAHFLVQTNWPAFGFDPIRSHWNPYENMLNTTSVAGLKPYWYVKTLNYITTSPVAANGYIYVGSADHKLYQINATTHKKIWFDTKNPIYSSPVVDSGMVYLTTYTAQLYALDALSLKVKWSATIGNTKAGNINESAPVVASEVINGISVLYVGSNDGNLYAFNASGCGNPVCTPLWKAATGNAIYSSPAVATEVINGTPTSVVYVGSNDGKLYAFNASTGTPLSSFTTFSTGGAIVASPTVVNGVVYVGSTDSVFYALNATTGTELWYYTTGNEIFSSAAVANGAVYVGSYDHNLYAFTIANCGSTGQVCQPTWMAPTGGYINSSPAVANGVVYVGSYDHKLYAFNANGCGNTSCPPLSTVSTSGPIKSSPVVINGVVYVGSYDFKFYAFH